MQPVPAKRRFPPLPGAILAIGILLSLFGVIGLLGALGYDPSAPTCDGEVMSPGDRCMAIDTSGGGNSGSHDYEEMKAKEATQYNLFSTLRNIGCTGGLVLTMVAVVWRRISNARTASRAGH